MDDRPQWSSERSFIFAVAAGSVGLGNLWRFPYMAGEHGGGSFIIAYLVAVVAVGVPLMILEFSAGRMARGGTVAMFRFLHKRASLVGWLIIALTSVILSYYFVITGWTLGFAVDSLRGSLTDFDTFTSGYASLWYFLAAGAITIAVLLGGLAGIERKTAVMMPLLLTMVVILTVYGLTLEGAGEAMSFILRPELGSLTDPTVWVFAFGQAFYSTSVGLGYLIAYGSFLPREVHVQRSTVAIAGTETLVALLAGLMIFPLVFTFGLTPDEGSSLAFNTLPEAFRSLTGGFLLAVPFFLLFFAAAISSCIMGMKVVVTTLREEFGLTNTRAVWVSMTVVMGMGVPSALSFTPIGLSLGGRPFLEVVDMFAATQVIITSGLVGGGLIAWLIPRETLVDKIRTRFRAEAHVMVTVGRLLPLAVALTLVVVALT
jgi:neurotransmitter:Na+ symporter, NSS family